MIPATTRIIPLKRELRSEHDALAQLFRGRPLRDLRNADNPGYDPRNHCGKQVSGMRGAR